VENELAVAQQQESVGVAAVSIIAPSFPDFPSQSAKRPISNWYLGIDFGSSGLAATLLDRASGQLYPIYWETKHSEASQAASGEAGASFRIPSIAVLEETANSGRGQKVIVVKSVGCRELALFAGEFLLENFKLPLKVGIPKRQEAGGMYEPLLQWSQDRAVSIALSLQVLRALLATLNPSLQGQKLGEISDSIKPANFEGLSVPNLICRAAGLAPEMVEAALTNLQGVIVGTPAGWSDAYRFNLREAVLGAGLVGESSQIFAVEDAIATLLGTVIPVENVNLAPSEAIESIDLGVKTKSRTGPMPVPQELFQRSIRNDRQSALPLALNASSVSGGTLILNAGATTVELALVDLPENLQDLTYADFTCQSFDFAGSAFDQDIICQLLAKNETWGMSIDLPRPGHPDLPSRYQLQQRLQSSDFGLQLLEAARHLKVLLQHQESFVLEIGDRRWDVKRRDLESLILVPFVQQLNRELNGLLSRVGMSSAGINQAICTGGMGSWPAIARWLRQKLPNAIVVQDRELEVDRDFALTHHNSALKSMNFNWKIGRVVCGLASLALYPQILDLPRQQYSDFFLLWELMQVLGKKTLSFEEIVQLLQRRGVNTRNCESRIMGILEGNLPAGLLPTEADFMMLAEESRQNLDWEAILMAPLFFQDIDRISNTLLLSANI
jgi:hypothetical protein